MVALRVGPCGMCLRQAEFFRYHYRYTDEQLAWLKGRCAEAETYCLFNNVPVCDEALRFLRMLDTSPGGRALPKGRD